MNKITDFQLFIPSKVFINILISHFWYFDVVFLNVYDRLSKKMLLVSGSVVPSGW